MTEKTPDVTQERSHSVCKLFPGFPVGHHCLGRKVPPCCRYWWSLDQFLYFLYEGTRSVTLSAVCLHVYVYNIFPSVQFLVADIAALSFLFWSLCLWPCCDVSLGLLYRYVTYRQMTEVWLTEPHIPWPSMGGRVFRRNHLLAFGLPNRNHVH